MGNKIKVVFNGEKLSTGKTFGISRYQGELLKRLDRKISRDMGITLVMPGGRKEYPQFNNINVVLTCEEANNRTDAFLWRRRVLPNFVESHDALGIDLEVALPQHGFKCVSLLDCIYKAYPQNFTRTTDKLSRYLYNKRVERLADNPKVDFVTLTETSRHDIERYYGVSEERIHIVSCGWEHIAEITPDYSILDALGVSNGKEYFFSLGSRFKHKNFEWVVNTARMNPGELFLITGSNEYSTSDQNLDNEFPTNVKFTGYVSDGQMKALMLGCKALIQPSFIEGFGLPPLEALALGKQILISDIPCFHEIYGNDAHYFDPYIPTDNINRILLSDAGDGTATLTRYTWEAAADELMHLIEILVGSAKSLHT